MSSFFSYHFALVARRCASFWHVPDEPHSWPRWVLSRTRRQARATALLYGAAFLILSVVAVQGLGSARIALELALVTAGFAWSIAQLRHVLRAERRLAEDVQRTIDSLPGTPLDGGTHR